MPLNVRRLLIICLAIPLLLAAACGEDGGGTLDGTLDDDGNDESNANQNDSSQNQNDPNENDSNENDPTENDPTENDPNENDPNENDPTENDPNENDPNENDSNQEEPSGPVIDGEACEADGDCEGDLCLNGNDWPYGYCTTIECESYLDCANDTDENACLLNPNGTNFCVRLCDPYGPDECRDGYQCNPLQGGEGWCAPDPNYSSGSENGGTEPPPEPTDPTETNFEGDCISVSGGYAQIDYNIASDTDQYTIIPFTQSGHSIWPSQISTPSTTIDFSGANSFQAMGAQMFGYVNPTIVPAAPQFDYQLSSGPHTYTLSTQASEVCYTLIESSGTASTIDLNIYIVGSPGGVTASNAASHSDMQDIIDRAETIYGQAGISFGDINYKSVSAQAEQQYSTVTSEQDVSALAAESEAPGSSNDDALSANIFIVEQFQMGGALGISLGIPGVPSWHGTPLSGVAMTGEDIGSTGGWGPNGNQLTANVLAHELGHFLGLFHTTEIQGNTINPIEDVPECSNVSSGTSCPDWGNLMFPSAAEQNVELTTGQSFVMGVNPLTK